MKKNGLIREVTTLDGANLVVFTTKFISSEIRHDKKGNLVEGALKERGYCTCNKTFTLSVTLYREGCFNFDEITVYVYCLPWYAWNQLKVHCMSLNLSQIVIFYLIDFGMFFVYNI